MCFHFILNCTCETKSQTRVTDSSVSRKSLCNLKGEPWRGAVSHQPGLHGPKHQVPPSVLKERLQCHAPVPEDRQLLSAGRNNPFPHLSSSWPCRDRAGG